MVEDTKIKQSQEPEKSSNKDDGFRPVRKFGFGGRRGEMNDGFDSKLLDLARVTMVTGGGKRMSFRAVVVVGDKKSKIGIGVDKGKDVSQAIEKATSRAKKSLINIVIVDGTIPHQVEAKVGPARILLKPQRKGRGLVAGGAVRTICELAGRKMVPIIRELIKRYPKLKGYRSFVLEDTTAIINLDILNKNTKDKDIINPENLVKRGIINAVKGKVPEVKILGNGKLDKKLVIENCKVSIPAKEAIEKAGGAVK